MPEPPHDSQRLRKAVLLVLVLGITTLFLWMISDFVIALIIAAIATGMVQPLHERLSRAVGGRRRIAALLTVLIVFLGLVVPATAFAGVVTAEAIQLSRIAGPWLKEQFSHGGQVTWLVERFPALNPVLEYRVQALEKLGEIAGVIGGYLVDALATAARETVTFFLLLFVSLYAMYFFLLDGRKVLWKILYYLPLTNAEEERMVQRFVSVARASIKGTIAMGALQGAMGGLGFWVLGVPSPALWATIMAVLSALPGVGAALVWIPAVGYLVFREHTGAAIALTIWCAGFVGTIDNFLRPRFIGKDAQMSDLMILLATLGGVVIFGVSGFILGPVVAALFVALWEIYGDAFSDVLPAGRPSLVEFMAEDGGTEDPKPSARPPVP